MINYETFDPRVAALAHAGGATIERGDNDKLLVSDVTNAIACGLVYVGDQLRHANQARAASPDAIEWLRQIRLRLVDDNDAVADVDLLYGIYCAVTGEQIAHPYEEGPR
jgi:hypothetical protein